MAPASQHCPTGEAKRLRDPPVSARASVDVTLTAKLWRFVVGRASGAYDDDF